MKRIAASHLTVLLIDKGYLIKEYSQELGRNTYIVTDKGQQAGMLAEDRVSEKGYVYTVVMYDDNAQSFLLSLIDRFYNIIP